MQDKVFPLNSVLNFMVPNVGLRIRLCDAQNAEQQVKVMTFLDFKLSPCSRNDKLSSGYFPGV